MQMFQAFKRGEVFSILPDFEERLSAEIHSADKPYKRLSEFLSERTELDLKTCGQAISKSPESLKKCFTKLAMHKRLVLEGDTTELIHQAATCEGK